MGEYLVLGSEAHFFLDYLLKNVVFFNVEGKSEIIKDMHGLVAFCGLGHNHQ